MSLLHRRRKCLEGHACEKIEGRNKASKKKARKKAKRKARK